MKTLYLILIGFLCILLGLIGGFTIKNYPLITWNKEVKIADVGEILATLSVGIIIPIVATKWMDVNRNVKFMLVDECKEALESVKKIKAKIDYCYINKSISSSDKDEIITLFTNSELVFGNLQDCVKSAFSNKVDFICGDILEESIKYWKTVTGGDLMISTYVKIDDVFYKAHNLAWSSFEHKVKKAILTIHTL